MTKDERLDLLVDKVKRGVQNASRRFAKDAIAQNKKLVSTRNGKIVFIHARDIK